MKSKPLMILLLAAMLFSLSACGTAQFTASAASGTAAAAQSQAATLQSKLAIGTLSLEDGDLAVTAEQAKTLLPLWKAVKSLTGNDNTAPAEITALYEQIQEAMTSDQVAAIQALEVNQETMTALMSKLNIEMPAPGGSGAATGSGSGNFPQMGDLPAGGAMPQGGGGGSMPGGGGGAMPGGDMQFNRGDAASGTQTSATSTGRQGGLGMSSMFVEPLIQLLQERAAQ